jgi:hypothetical protein
VSTDLRFSRVGRPRPKRLPGSFVETPNLPGLRRIVTTDPSAGGRVLERCRRVTTDRRRNTDLVVPNDGARVSETGNGRLPDEIPAVFAIPRNGWRFTVRNTRRVRTTEHWPIVARIMRRVLRFRDVWNQRPPQYQEKLRHAILDRATETPKQTRLPAPPSHG